MIEQVLRTNETDLRYGYLPAIETLDTYNELLVLQDLVEIMATYPDFDYLTPKEYNLDLQKTESTEDEDEDEDEDLRSDDSDDFDDSDDSYDSEASSGSEPPCYSKETQMAVFRWKPNPC